MKSSSPARAHQALHLLALDPVLETNADRNSYGFRQKRSCADAIGQCFITLSNAPNTQWILEADIKFPMTGFWRTSLWTVPFSNSG
jgi:hypothetical protein